MTCDKNPIEIYQTEDGQTQIEVLLNNESLWLNLQQIATLFDRDKSVISRHLGNIFKTDELDKHSVVANNATTAKDGKTYQVDYYNLDVIISVGYRVNSKKGTQFRIWATQRLKEHLLQGYTLNQQRFEQNAKALQQALKLIEKTAKSPDLTLDAGRGLTEIVSRYTQTFLWLQAYDEGLLEEPTGEAGGDLPTAEHAMQSLEVLKKSLMERGETTDLFARPRAEGLQGIFGNLEQSVFGEPAYPTIESKAAHLLYFVVKNHPFSDGNKRSGAFLFVDFLHRNRRLLNAENEPVINDTGLAALTLLVAESDPKQKETLIRLIMHMLSEGTIA
ncbi:virulence protein RhuM/Fic/DOC family protein [bacterium endosymbiont of Bathymodiolus sp. 5 South]|jgi:prophage maintenance system killer protein/phage regulator Rha-like protein|uniref:virulence protein RhuM/Fic/DOC family protein n=1 Tax=bacterium endosymbiont of Bathymodiolus sp. 5 South TaxID=1181670 RepID=UPI0010BC3ADD|nr:virulence protein RhuM/Fic/DOC family protein [bacterium endosymbiont of Bathymodiolus sp. 5 South]SSC09332.1 Putative DNA-binding protein in cluster with Type I restriction-modification system [bacterium endosymbiont of Bathymodiolus sp. 5 South]VVH58992.1 Putative DNA-binding protein in cluster with Type I restriction-modification system [uncultured Gammaproteobacteria bacterium]VVH62751.1 Putative DNA-binding protein in cluster with Type I restriction-modification system [uncultured Gammap